MQIRQSTSPRQGPRILFFSGGTALRDTAHELTHHTHNTVHIVTPFDSGGSSAALRTAFAMPAMGDIRARIMALADDHALGKPEMYTLFAYRLPQDATERERKTEAATLARGTHPLLRQIPEPMKGIVRQHLGWFLERMPKNFPLGGASVGNLVLTGGYLEGGRKLYPVIALFSRLVHARGVVRPITDRPAHLAVRLESGEIIVGQHNFTGKEHGAVNSPIADIWLTSAIESAAPIAIPITAHTARRIREAQAICYPVGSFYSSLVANLLPTGVGTSVALAQCPKIFVPNIGNDPELLGHTIQRQVEQLLRPLLADAPMARPKDMLTTVLLDAEKEYYGGIPEQWLHALGISVRRVPLVRAAIALADARLLCRALLEAAGNCARNT